MEQSRIVAAPLLVGLALLVLAGIIVWDVVRLSGGGSLGGYGVGPDLAPKIVAAFLAILGGSHIVAGLRGMASPAQETAETASVVIVIAALAFLVVSIPLGLGTIPTLAVVFALIARALGRRAFLVDLTIGAVIGLFAYGLFARVLGLSLPSGPAERLLF